MRRREEQCYVFRKDSRGINACDFLSGLGFDEFVVDEEADRLLVLPSVRGFETNEKIRTHFVSRSQRIYQL